MRIIYIFFGIIGFTVGLILLAVLFNFAYRFLLRSRFWIRYGRNGKFILFVYSNSPNWKDYTETNIIPRIESHTVILNWSERKNWNKEHSFEKKVFRKWAGYKEFNPVAIVFQRTGKVKVKVKVIRFWLAFRDYKHGKDGRLKRAEAELFKELCEHPTV